MSGATVTTEAGTGKEHTLKNGTAHIKLLLSSCHPPYQVVVIYNGADAVNVRFIQVTATARTLLSTTDFSLSSAGITDIEIGADVAPVDSAAGGTR